MSAGAQTLLRRVGLGLRYVGPHLWAHCERSSSFRAALPLLRRLLAEHPRYRLLVTAPTAALRREAAAAAPEATVLAPPLGGDLLVRRVFGAMRPHLLLLLGPPRGLGLAVLRRAHRWPMPILLLQGPDDPVPSGLGPRLRLLDAALLRDGTEAATLREAGLPGERIAVIGASDPLPAIRAALRRDWSSTDAPRGIIGCVRRLLATAPGRVLLRRRAEPLAGLEALADALGRPDTILCLGNGPSSEDPRLLELGVHRLFRVNHRWRGGGFLAAPDMVFTGDIFSVLRLAPALFGFRTIEEETQILLRYGLRRRAPPIRYLTAERLPLPLNETRWPARPTNGVVMIAVAAALAPRRLAIAGIDLYEHPAGIYPGAAGAPDGYFLLHDREVELAIIRRSLEGFRGELAILSEPLARRLA